MCRPGLDLRALMAFEVTETDGVPVKAWTRGVPFEDAAKQQVRNLASLPFVFRHVAVMPDVHWGLGATVGSVFATRGAIVPAAVGVDIGCGMVAARTNVTASQLPDGLGALRSSIERAVPHGRTDNGGRNDRGAWRDLPKHVGKTWKDRLEKRFEQLVALHPTLAKSNHARHLGTLGTGNHFIEVCLDEEQRVWVMLHSGSRGIGGRIGSHFIKLAKQDMERWFIQLPDANLAYLPQGSDHYEHYLLGVGWAQDYARTNRQLMLEAVLDCLRESFPDLEIAEEAVNCHHNYVNRERHYGEDVWVTRKGAVRARQGELGIIPGSMGARSYIVRGKGNRESFASCSHGAGRRMSRSEAKKKYTVEDHARATEGVECRKDAGVIDETPAAYKDINAVMAAQEDLVDVVHTLKQILCVKG